jgi:hypothetical protein
MLPVYSLTRFRGHRNVALTLRSSGPRGQDRPSHTPESRRQKVDLVRAGRSPGELGGFDDFPVRVHPRDSARADQSLTLINILAEFGAPAAFQALSSLTDDRSLARRSQRSRFVRAFARNRGNSSHIRLPPWRLGVGLSPHFSEALHTVVTKGKLQHRCVLYRRRDTYTCL